MTTVAAGRAVPARRWWARGSLLLVAAAAAVLVVFGEGHGIGVLLVAALALVVTVAAGYWFLEQRGALRWVALGVVVAAPIVMMVTFIASGLLWVVLLAAALLLAAVWAARQALQPDPSGWSMTTVDALPPAHPWFVMNPRSGGGKVVRFGLKEKAEALGAEVELLDGPGMDVQQMAQAAVARGADLLGVAGGDGTQALVAQVAASHGLPFLVVSAGTRNHFALDLGLDREDPSRCLDALRDGVEVRIDLGDINGRTFVNNASFGAYAEVVQSPEYRDDKRGTTLEALPDLLRGTRGAHLQAHVGDTVIDAPQAVLVSNDPYDASDLAGLGRRPRLDRGVLGVVAVRVDSVRQAVGLLHRAHSRGLTIAEARDVVVTADAPTIPVGIDGEAVLLETPVRCTISPGALRVRLPVDRPGARPPGATLAWAPLWELATAHGNGRHHEQLQADDDPQAAA
jgi:diacylglycerol kinase family enzyme